MHVLPCLPQVSPDVVMLGRDALDRPALPSTWLPANSAAWSVPASSVSLLYLPLVISHTGFALFEILVLIYFMRVSAHFLLYKLG